MLLAVRYTITYQQKEPEVVYILTTFKDNKFKNLINKQQLSDFTSFFPGQLCF